jgi:hypothetical protein
MNRWLFLLLVLGMWLLVGCGGGDEGTTMSETTAVSSPPAATTTSSTSTPPPPTPTNTPTPSPTPVAPLLEVEAQILGPDGVVQITAVQSPVEAILALYQPSGASLSQNELLAYVPVAIGRTNNLTVEVPVAEVGTSLQAALQVMPAGEETFDTAVAELLLLTEFDIDNQAIPPVLEISQEQVGVDGLLIIDRLISPVAGWLAAYNENNPTQLVGFVPVQAGENVALPLYLQWQTAETDLLFQLYRDDGVEVGRFEATDTPVLFAGAPASYTHTINLPAQLQTLDQPVVNGQVLVPRVVSDGPGFVVIFQTENNQRGFIIGSQFVPHGVSHNVLVSVTQAAVTPQLMLVLYRDNNESGSFTPGVDEPQTAGGQQFVVTMNTDIGTYLVAADQPTGAEVVVPLVAAEAPVWVVIRGERLGEDNTAVAGDILGQLLVPAGVSQDIRIPLNTTPEAGSTLWAMLYQSNDPQESFDPATDPPIIRRREPLAATFLVTE